MRSLGRRGGVPTGGEMGQPGCIVGWGGIVVKDWFREVQSKRSERVRAGTNRSTRSAW